MAAIGVSGSFRAVHFAPDGRLLWDKLFHNAPTVEGLNYVLEAAFRLGPKQAGWWQGLIDNAGFGGVLPTDTHASHPTWNEYTGVYLGQRPAWTPAAASSGAMGATASTTVQVTASGKVRGLFLAGRQAVGTGAGVVLYATAVAAAGLDVVAGGTINVGYQSKFRPKTGG